MGDVDVYFLRDSFALKMKIKLVCHGFANVKISGMFAVLALITSLMVTISIPASATEKKTSIEIGAATSVFPEYSISEDGLVIAILYLREQRTGKTLDLHTSFDGGQSWNSQLSIAKRVSPWNFKVEVSKNGKDITVIWIEDGLDSGLWFKNSKDSGKNWNKDQFIETLNARNKNRLKLSQSRDGSTKLITYFADAQSNSLLQTFFQNTSMNAGQTWLFTNNSKDDIQQPYGDSKVSDDGQLLAYTYESYGNKATQGQLRFSTSKDGLNWLPESTIDTGNAFSPDSKIVVLKEGQMVINYDNTNSLLISSDNGRNFNKLKLPVLGFLKNFWINESLSQIYVSSVDSASNGRIVSFSASSDSGITWLKPVKVIDGVGNESDLIVSPNGMTMAMLTVSWDSSSLFLQMSENFGKTWSLPQKVSSVDERIRTAFDGYRFGIHLDEVGSKVLIVYNAFNLSNDSYSQSLARIPYYRIKFEGTEKALGTVPETLISIDGSPITIPAKANDFFKPNFSFVGWSRDRNAQGDLLLPGQLLNDIGSNISLYAIWKELPSFDLVFHSNQVLTKTPNQLKIWEDSTETAPKVDQKAVMSGISFLNWNTSPNGKGLTLKPGQNIASFYFSNKISGTLNLYALGEKLPVKGNTPVKMNETIICVKGKLSKKVTAVKPKCPSGYKLKK